MTDTTQHFYIKTLIHFCCEQKKVLRRAQDYTTKAVIEQCKYTQKQENNNTHLHKCFSIFV